MDHTNVIHPSTKFSCDQVPCQRLTLEEYGVTLKYIKGTDNVVIDALSRLLFAEIAQHKEDLNVFEAPPAPPIGLRRIRENQETFTNLAHICTFPGYQKVIQDHENQGVALTYYNSLLCHRNGTFRIFTPINICAELT